MIKQFRRSGGADTFKVTSSTVVCEFHFKTSEIKVSSDCGKKSLVPGAVPTIFKFKPKISKACKAPLDCSNMPSSSRPVSNQSSEKTEVELPDTGNVPGCLNCACHEQEIEKLQKERSFLEEELHELRRENIYIKEELESLRTNSIYNFSNISSCPELFVKATGLEVKAFQDLFVFLKPGENCNNIKFYETIKRAETDNNATARPTSAFPGKKRGPKPKSEPIDQLFMCLTWLKNGFTLSHMSWLFKLPKSTISRHLISWINFLYFSLGSLPIWPSKEVVQKSMPASFKKTFPSTRCIIDCTELFCQRPSSLAIQSSLYSSYKHHVTYKALIGIAPSGAITFVGQLFDGSISDKEIVKRSGFLNSSLWDERDSLMADRGFTISEDLKPLKVQLNIPAFLGGIDQLSEEEVLNSQTIASVRIHVERAIQRVKKFRLIRNEIPLVLHGSVNQIWTVCCLLCNFMHSKNIKLKFSP
ncbi:uncharacterized protein LOC135694784 [Rhopilema esculentum]|uniref:uncharacterized protein LOC135694784 n=1 Tax=Rhopilema esculentum TaxID=499914 RepID=UPI0031D2F567